MTVKLLNQQHLEFLSLKGGYTRSSESTHVKMPHCWKSHVVGHMYSYHMYWLRNVIKLVKINQAPCLFCPLTKFKFPKRKSFNLKISKTNRGTEAQFISANSVFYVLITQSFN